MRKRKLSFSQEQELRARYTGAFGEKKQLAEEYGVSLTTIANIVGTRKQIGCDKLRKLTGTQVQEIKAGYTGRRGEMTALAKRYGVTQQTISLILKEHPIRPQLAIFTREQAREIRASYTGRKGEILSLARQHNVARETIARTLYRRVHEYED